jgi:hypothetical protein
VHERRHVCGRRVHVRGVSVPVVVRVRGGLGGHGVRREPGRVRVIPVCKWCYLCRRSFILRLHM